MLAIAVHEVVIGQHHVRIAGRLELHHGNFQLIKADFQQCVVQFACQAQWPELVTEALEKAGKEKTAIPVYMFCANVVRMRMVAEEGELAGKMLAAGMVATPMCGVTWAGTKGFSDRVRGVTNSAKTRNYSTIRYLPDQTLVDVIVNGKMPA